MVLSPDMLVTDDECCCVLICQNKIYKTLILTLDTVMFNGSFYRIYCKANKRSFCISFDCIVLMASEFAAGKPPHASHGQDRHTVKTFLSWNYVKQIFSVLGISAFLFMLIALLSDARFILLMQRCGSKLSGHDRPTNFSEFEKGDDRHTWCLLYDKAPRTGSTTVARSLENCWKSIRGIDITNRDERFDTGITMLLETPYRQVTALVGSHFTISISDTTAMQSKCENVLYFTSTRTMSERLWSEAKYFVSEATAKRNTSLAVDDVPLVWFTLFERLYESELYLENYPFVKSYKNPGTFSRNLIDQMIVPSYVIRTEHMYRDLSFLLKAFQCSDENIRVTNMPTVEGKKDEKASFGASDNEFQNTPKNLSSIPLRFDDYRNKYLLQLAESVNEYGLLSARKVVAV